MERRAKQAAMPLALAALCILLISGAFAHGSRAAWALLVLTGTGAMARWGLGHRRLHHAAECGQLLAGVAQVEEVLRGALSVAQAALHPHTVAVFLLAPDGESVRLRECISESDRLFRGPLQAREGALGAVLSSLRSVRLDSAAEQLTYYEGRAPVGAFCAVPLQEGALVADRAASFSDGDQRVLEALAAEVTRAIDA